MKSRCNDRKGLAAVEAALCLPLLIIIWLGSYEMVHALGLKQQGQLLCSTAANRVIESSVDFETIESDVVTMSESIGIIDCVVDVQRLDSEVVESVVTIDFSKNSVFGSIFRTGNVTSSFYSFREE